MTQTRQPVDGICCFSYCCFFYTGGPRAGATVIQTSPSRGQTEHCVHV